MGSYPSGVTPYGVYDMAGNVMERTSSLYKPYPYKHDDGSKDAKAEGSRVLRGGSWRTIAEAARASARQRNRLIRLDSFDDDIGFRWAKTP